jgi:spore coat protein CotH
MSRVPTSRAPRIVVAVFVATLALAARPAARDDAGPLFDDGVVHSVRLTIHSQDLAALRAGFDTNTFYPADLQWRDQRVRNVGVRSRGTGSRNPHKLGLLVDFGRYAPGQRFLGLTSLVLDNFYQDPSMMREPLAMGLLRRLGQPAPRQAYAHFAINNVPQGLYGLVETITPDFTEVAFNESGLLFEYHWAFPFYADDLGDDVGVYAPLFEPQNAGVASAEAIYGPIRELFRDINDPDEAVWLERVEARIDLPELLRHVGAEAFMAELDGFLGYAGMNNFYLYRYAGTNRHRVLSWDRDFAFAFLDTPIFERAHENVLMRRALERPELRALFLDAIEAASASATADGWLAAEVDRMAALIMPAAIKDLRRPFSTQEFLDAVEFLRLFAAERPSIVAGQIEAARASGGGS